MNTADSLRGEAAALVRIGGPLTLTALANMGVSITDVIMIGWLGPMLLGAGAAISDLYSIFYYLAAGIASAGAAILSSAIGASNHERLRGMFAEVLIATLAAGAVLVPLVWHGAVVLAWLGIEAEVLPDAAGYAHWLAAAMLPMLVVRACIAWFSAVGRTTVVFAFTLSAIPLNVVANGVLMFGWFGGPVLGMPGAGAASLLVALYLAGGLSLAVCRSEVFRRAPPGRPRARGIVECWSIGVPVGVSSLAELGVYLFSTVIVVAFGAAAVAAHAVVLRLSGVLYAFALGLSQAVTVRVARGAGTGSAEQVARLVGAALALACVIALVEWVALWIFADRIAALFIPAGSHAASTAALAALLIGILAPVEAIGAIGTTAIGALRGVGDTRVPMAWSLAALWGVGFCVAMYLAFEREMGVAGYWIGLLAGTVVLSAACLVRMWRRLVPRGRHDRTRRGAGSRASLATRW